MAKFTFPYAGIRLTFGSLSQLEEWCDRHAKLYAGVSTGARGYRSDPNAVFNAIKAKPNEAANVIKEVSGKLLPIIEEPAGLFFEGLKKRDEGLFKLALQGWEKFGREATKANQGVNSNEVTQLAVITMAEASAGIAEPNEIRKAVELQRSAAAELEDIKTRFEEYMVLKSPTDYWKGKRTAHSESKGKRLRGIVVGGGIGIVVALLIPALFVYSIMPSMSDVLQRAGHDASWALYGFGFFYVTLMTAVFWLLRVLTKLYLSDHHLEIDADERITMIQTYHALLAENAVSSDERLTVLNGIFRHTEDGVVKDDGIDPGIAGLLSRIISR